MGRIAEALKRAEEERRRHLAEHSSSGATMVLEAPCPTPAPVHSPPEVFPDEPEGDASPPTVSEDLHESIVPFYDRSSLISEQYRSLRTRLLTHNPQNDHRVIAITSAIPREGKSVTTINLGMVLAEIRHFKVLCVDGDFRRSRLAHLLDTPPSPGLADYLRGEASYEEIVQPTPIPNLFFVGAGDTAGRSSAELLSSQKASTVIRRFQTEYHYTMVDTPPATTVTDVGIIGQMCNGVIMLVRLNFTPEHVAQRAVRLLRVNKVPILGCLLIGRSERTGGYGYGYGYYNYYYRESSRNRR